MTNNGYFVYIVGTANFVSYLKAIFRIIILQKNRYIRNKPLNRILRAICYVIIGVTVVGRLIAGVHWFTDILGGILISVTLLSLYEEVISHGK